MIKDIKRYLIYTFSFSWLLWGAAAVLTHLKLAGYGTPVIMILFVIGGIMPAICEIWLKKRYSSKTEFKAFIKNVISPRHSVIAYIFVIGLAFLFCFLPTLWHGATMKQPVYMAILELPMMIIGGGLEEIGWRGFLQPEVQKKLPPFISTLIVGTIWAVWHLPLWFVAGSDQSTDNFLWFFISVLALSLLLTQIYSATKSIFMCMIFHAFINAFWDVYVPTSGMLSAALSLILAVLIFILVESVLKWRKLCKTV